MRTFSAVGGFVRRGPLSSSAAEGAAITIAARHSVFFVRATVLDLRQREHLCPIQLGAVRFDGSRYSVDECLQIGRHQPQTTRAVFVPRDPHCPPDRVPTSRGQQNWPDQKQYEYRYHQFTYDLEPRPRMIEGVVVVRAFTALEIDIRLVEMVVAHVGEAIGGVRGERPGESAILVTCIFIGIIPNESVFRRSAREAEAS